MNKKILLGGVIILFFTQILFSQNQGDTISIFDISLEQLMQLKVDIASNVIKDKQKQPASITTISNEQLELSGGRTLLEAISYYVPGMFIVEDQDDVIVGSRGLAPDNNSKMMLLVNGNNLNTEFFWGPPSAVLNSTNFDYIDRIEVIRGPGSVTLGQGALLGVINIITKSDESNSGFDAKIAGGYGLNNFINPNLELTYNKRKFNAYVNFGYHKYDGQKLQEKGWAKDRNNDGYLGGKIIDIGTRLKKSLNNDVFAEFSYGNFNLDVMFFDQKKDLYNFYRDRNVFRQTLGATALSYNKKITPKIGINAKVDFAYDDFGLYSVDGYTMGGTMEKRVGGKFILNFNQLIEKNYLAVGSEYKYFNMGNKNYEGNNFINNLVSSQVMNNYNEYIASANREKVFGYHSTLPVYSFFIEDFQDIGYHLSVFGALRYDNHPSWGDHFSPRLGVITTINDDLIFKLVYQEGFRGAVGLNYSGGFRHDGFLSAENFDKIEAANVQHYDTNGNLEGTYPNVDVTQPEQMKSLEFTVDYNLGQYINVDAVGFYDVIKNVIDVGVIWEDSKYYTVPPIGTDVPGDWNGYWYFKNTEGAISQAGVELTTTFKNKFLYANVSHSLVKLLKVDDQQLGSMYVTANKKHKAYPENVTRFNLMSVINKSFRTGFTGMYYYNWFSPTDQKVGSNILLNLSAIYEYKRTLKAQFTVANILNQKVLYPMNSNVGDASLSDGSPAIETITFWTKFSFFF